ncbi:hypothetical protein NMY22_g8510 [Coprinellus aureogranulatus]|nr:hypothetical protein NMY22_g8510 [Coprinellus aureogranulatus]
MTTKRPMWPIVPTEGWKITHFCPIQLARPRSQPPQHPCNVQAHLPSLLLHSLFPIARHFDARPLWSSWSFYRTTRRSVAQVPPLLRGKHHCLRLEEGGARQDAQIRSLALEDICDWNTCSCLRVRVARKITKEGAALDRNAGTPTSQPETQKIRGVKAIFPALYLRILPVGDVLTALPVIPIHALSLDPPALPPRCLSLDSPPKKALVIRSNPHSPIDGEAITSLATLAGGQHAEEAAPSFPQSIN